MRLILEVMGRVVGFEASLLHVKMVSSDDQEEQVEQLGHDPHSTVSSHIERRSDLEDMYGKQKFGFAHVTDAPDGSQG